MGMDARMWDNGRKNIKLNQAGFTHMGSLGKDPNFDAIAWGVSCYLVAKTCPTLL